MIYLVLFLGAALLIYLNLISTPSYPQEKSKNLWIGAVVSGVFAVWVLLVLYALTGRTYFTFLLGASLALALWAGNQLKVKVLHEVLVFSDAFLAIQALKFPKLYFGYAPKWFWPALWGVAIFLLIWFGMEPTSISFLGRFFLLVFCALVGTGVVLSFFKFPLQAKKILDKFPLSFNANEDAKRYTPIGEAFLDCLWHARFRMDIRKKFRYQTRATKIDDIKVNASPKHLILIQAESYCHLKNSSVKTRIFDLLSSQGNHGELILDWRGAYTMRTEFAVLSGIKPQELQTYGFDPFRLVALEPMKSLARELKEKGFRTVFWHPNSGIFFNRNEVMKNFGFDECQFGESFEHLAKNGDYVSDEALLKEAENFISHQEVKTFLFIVTMEAHGPWGNKTFLGKVLQSDSIDFEKHLVSMDNGLRALKKGVNEDEFDAVIGFYGDHLPGLTEQNRLPLDPPWFIWNGKPVVNGNCTPDQLNKKIFNSI